MKSCDKDLDPLKLGVPSQSEPSQGHLKFQSVRDESFLKTGSTRASEGIIGINW